MTIQTTGSATSLALVGLQAHVVRITATVSKTARGGSFRIEGMPEAPSRETRLRVMCALDTVDVACPDYAIGVSVAVEGGAGAPKGASCAPHDLAIAAAILRALGRMPEDDRVMLAELSLSGELLATRGTLAALMSADLPRAIVPAAAGEEAAMAPSIAIWSASSLAAVVRGEFGRPTLPASQLDPGLTMADLPPHFDAAVRQLKAAAKSGSQVLLVGAPGCGATMLARRAPSLLADMTESERLDVARIRSAAGLPGRGLPERRPFRAPHHTCSAAALVGGGAPVRPGEVTLAHRGVLFLDELVEFRRHTLEGLGAAVRSGTTSCRESEFPSAPWVIATVHRCPCGNRGTRRRCNCSTESVDRYRTRVDSLSRLFDVRIDMPPVPAPQVA